MPSRAVRHVYRPRAYLRAVMSSRFVTVPQVPTEALSTVDGSLVTPTRSQASSARRPSFAVRRGDCRIEGLPTTAMPVDALR